MKRIQCKACPWRKSTVPERDIPGGYDAEKHARLPEAVPGDPTEMFSGVLHVMACHESRDGAEIECVGWLVNQLGPGNNLALRLAARDGRYDDLRTVGPQHACLRDTLPKSRR